MYLVVAVFELFATGVAIMVSDILSQDNTTDEWFTDALHYSKN